MGKNTRIFYGWWVVAAGFGMWISLAANPFSIILKQLMAEFNSGRGAVSILPALFSIAGGIGAIFVSRLIRRYSPRKIMLWSSVIGGILFLLCSITTELWQLYILYFLCGLVLNGGAGVIPILAILSNWFEKKRGLAVGITFAGMALGGVIIIPFIGIIANEFGWRATYLFCGGLTLLLNVPLAALVLKNSPKEMGLLPDGDTPETVNLAMSRIKTIATGKAKIPSTPLIGYLKRPAIWFIIISFPLMAFNAQAIMQHLVSFVTDMNISATVAASALGITGGIGGISGLVSGWLCDKMPRKHVMTMFGAIFIISIVILINTHSSSMLWLFVIVFGFGNGAFGIVFPLVVGDIFGAEGYLTVYGFVNLFFCFGLAFGPPLAGYIFDASGSYFIVFMIVAASQIVSVAAIYVAYAIERKRKKATLIR